MDLRAFTWAALSAYTHVVNSVSGGSPLTLEQTRALLGQPGLQPERNLFLAHEGQTVVGSLLVVPEPLIHRAILELGVLPEHRRKGIGAALLEKGVAHSRTLRARHVNASCHPGNVAATALLRSHHFREVRRQWLLRSTAAVPPPLALPPGHTLRSLSEQDLHAFTHLQNRSFEASWGYHPNTPEEQAYRVRLDGGAFADVVALFAGETPVSFCWTRLRREGTERLGIIWMIGTNPDVRAKGLARAVLVEGLRRLHAQGATTFELAVYADNPAAIKLYESVGFRRQREIVWWEKSLA